MDIEEAKDMIAVLIGSAQRLLDEMNLYFSHHGAEHENLYCPEDDTCRCLADSFGRASASLEIALGQAKHDLRKETPSVEVLDVDQETPKEEPCPKCVDAGQIGYQRYVGADGKYYCKGHANPLNRADGEHPCACGHLSVQHSGVLGELQCLDCDCAGYVPGVEVL